MPSLIHKIATNILRHNGFRRYFKNSAWMLFEKILRILSGILVGAYIARYLGPKEYGILNYALAFTALFGGLGRLRINELLVRELVKKPDDNHYLLGTGFWIKTVGSLFALLFIAIALAFIETSYTDKVFIMIVASSLLLDNFYVVKSYFNAKVKSKFVSICSSVQILTSAAVKITLVLIGANLFWFVIMVLIDAMILTVALVVSYLCFEKRFFITAFDKERAILLLKQSGPLIISGIISSGYMKIDQVMLKSMLNEEAVGLYSAAAKISEGWYFMPAIIVGSTFPALVSAHKKSLTLFFDRSLYIMTALFWGAVFVALIINLISEEVIYILFGQEYKASSMILNIHIWAAPFFFISSVWDKMMIVQDQQKYIILKHVFLATVNISLNFLLIPHYGTNGAAWATALAFIMNTLFILALYRPAKMYSLMLDVIVPIPIVKQLIENNVNKKDS